MWACSTVLSLKHLKPSLVSHQFTSNLLLCQNTSLHCDEALSELCCHHSYLFWFLVSVLFWDGFHAEVTQLPVNFKIYCLSVVH